MPFLYENEFQNPQIFQQTISFFSRALYFIYLTAGYHSAGSIFKEALSNPAPLYVFSIWSGMNL
jgi:hypothetical protein